MLDDDKKLISIYKEIVDYILNKYSQIQTYELAAKTNQEAPWDESFHSHDHYDNNFISDEVILDYYSEPYNII